MKSFYSLIKININSVSDDNLTIGLICFSDNRFQFAFSNHRKKQAKNILNDSNFIIDYFEREISLKLENLNKSNLMEANQNVIDLNYFNYLSKYNNGILRITKPNFIDDTVDEIKFNSLYRTFLNENIEKVENRIKAYSQEDDQFSNRIMTNLISRVEDRIHTHQKFNKTLIPSLISQFELDCIGKNGILVGAKSLDLTQSKATLNAHTNGYINVITHLSYKLNLNPFENNFYLICDEPVDVSTEEHLIWEYLCKENLFSVINSEEVDKVVYEIEKSNASRFLDELSTI